MNYYVTTSIPYVNGEPHIGHALEFLMADVLARAARQQGKPTLFSTGTDEHGTKNVQKAESMGLTPQQFADQMSAKFRDLGKLLNITPDRFIRTTDETHEQRAQLIWKALEHDIYKSKYVGWYDVKQEEFVPENRVDPERTNPDHPQAYQKLEEENYFFRLSNYTDKIRETIESGAFKIIPETRRNEILSVLREGLEDLSISRPKEKLDWGIAVPGDPNQVMYVWFEALMNYITVLGYPEHDDFKKFWPANVQVIGKDIIRFHAAIWPAILMSLGLPLPEVLYVHGFVTRDGKAMSKSLGNGIEPREVIEKYGTDAFRYFFLRHIPSYNDGDFSWETFDAAYNHELANELGNAVQRTAAMIQKYQNGIIGNIPEAEHDTAPVAEAIEQCHFDRALDEIWDQVRGLNQYIDEEKPWAIAKAGDADHLREVLAYQASCLLEIADLLVPFLPETAEKIKKIFGEGIVRPIEGTLFPKQERAEAAA
ncbi:MAG TPA: methionine--tRNA ligase [Candidatus Saccharimonadales bacterium]|jgi:methionyl-tRNA synthetase|nr:methionine--tRNA ligase [Candidatus Saccharimonadales bacterium]